MPEGVPDRPLVGRAPVTVETDLTVRVAGTAPTVESTGDRLFVEFQSLAEATRALRARPTGLWTALDPLLRTLDLTLEVRVRDRTVAVAGADARPGPISKRLGAGVVEARPSGLLAAAWVGLTELAGTAGGVLRGPR